MNTGLFLPNNGSSSTPGFQYYPLSSNVQENSRNNSTASEVSPEYYNFLLTQIQNLQSSVHSLQQSSDTSKTFFKESVLLQRVCLIIIILLPLVLAAVASVVALVFSTEAALKEYAKICLGVLGVSGLVDLIFIFATHRIDAKRLEQLERMVDKLEKQY